MFTITWPGNVRSLYYWCVLKLPLFAIASCHQRWKRYWNCNISLIWDRNVTKLKTKSGLYSICYETLPFTFALQGNAEVSNQGRPKGRATYFTFIFHQNRPDWQWAACKTRCCVLTSPRFRAFLWPWAGGVQGSRKKLAACRRRSYCVQGIIL